ELDAFDAEGVAYEFTVKEKAVDGYNLESITGDMESGFTITNVITTSIDVTKEWLDDQDNTDRPEEIIVELHRNGVRITEVTLDEAGDWKYTFENLEVYDP